MDATTLPQTGFRLSGLFGLAIGGCSPEGHFGGRRAIAQFSLRKAIGWALRGLAHTDPDEVARYVRENESRLSPLSTREALKNIPDN